MIRKIIPLAIGIAVVVLAAGTAFWQGSGKKPVQQPQPGNSQDASVVQGGTPAAPSSPRYRDSDGDDDGDDDRDDDDSTAATPSSQNTPSPVPSPTPVSSPGSYALSEVQAHATAASCWAAVNGSVYDLTPWIAQHPGGERAILGLCGTDGSAAFNAQHGSQTKANQALASFKIGLLIK